MNIPLAQLIFIAGVGQLGVLIAAALVPLRLNWRDELRVLPRLHRQMYWTYGGYVLMSIVALALLSIANARELASGSGLARGLSAYIACFWGIRLALQAVFDVKAYLTAWWLKAGYVVLAVLFAGFTVVYTWAAVQSPLP